MKSIPIVNNIILRPTTININMNSNTFNQQSWQVNTVNNGMNSNTNHNMSPTTQATAKTTATTTTAASSSMDSNTSTASGSDAGAAATHAQNNGPPDDNGTAQNNGPPDDNGTAQQTDAINNDQAFETDEMGNLIFPPHLLKIEIKDMKKESHIISHLDAYKLFKNGNRLADFEKDNKSKILSKGLVDLRNKILEVSRNYAYEYMSFLCYKEGLIKEGTKYSSVRDLVSGSSKTSLKTVFDETPSLLCSFLMKIFIQKFSPLEFDHWLIPKVKTWCSKAENIDRNTHRPFTFKTTFWEDGKSRLVKHEISKIAIKGANNALHTFLLYVYNLYGYTLLRSSNKGKDKEDQGNMLVEMKYIMSLDGGLLDFDDLNLNNNNSSTNKERNVYLKINLKRFGHLKLLKKKSKDEVLDKKGNATHARAVFEEFNRKNSYVQHYAHMLAMELKRTSSADGYGQTVLNCHLKVAQKIFNGQSNDQSSHHASAKLDLEQRFFKSAPLEASSNRRSYSTAEGIAGLSNSLQATSNEVRQVLSNTCQHPECQNTAALGRLCVSHATLLLLASNNHSQPVSSSTTVRNVVSMPSQSSLNQSKGSLPQPNPEGNGVGAAGKDSSINDEDNDLGDGGGNGVGAAGKDSSINDEDNDLGDGGGGNGATSEDESINDQGKKNPPSRMDRQLAGVVNSRSQWSIKVKERLQRSQQSSGEQESTSSSSYSSSSDSDCSSDDNDIIQKRRRKLEQDRKRSRGDSDSSSESSDSEEDDSEDEECVGVCNGYRNCKYSGLSLLRCSHQGCRRSVHQNCQDGWELTQEINDPSIEPYCANHHPAVYDPSTINEMPNSEEDDPLPQKKKRKLVKKKTLSGGKRIAFYSHLDEVDHAWSAGTIVSDSERAQLINKTDGECYNDVEIEWDEIVSKKGEIAYYGGVYKTDLITKYQVQPTEENLQLLMPTTVEEKEDLLNTWIVGEKANEIMELQLQERGIKFEVRKPFCLSISFTFEASLTYVYQLL